jgi:mannose-6-phosphate isomerase-like protein (cupin superfamily)
MRGRGAMVFKRNRSEAPRRERDGLVSHVLLKAGDPPGTRLTVTWVDIGPGSGQIPHSHVPEQVYVVVRGRGKMKVGEEERLVVEGDLIHIPSETPHGIENLSDDVLTYVSAATPALDCEAFYHAAPGHDPERERTDER